VRPQRFGMETDDDGDNDDGGSGRGVW